MKKRLPGKMGINSMVFVLLLMVTAPVFSFDPPPVNEIRYQFFPVVIVVSDNSQLYGSLKSAVETEPGDIVGILTENQIISTDSVSFKSIDAHAQKAGMNVLPLGKMVNMMNKKCQLNMKYAMEYLQLTESGAYQVMKTDMEDAPGLSVGVTVKSPPSNSSKKPPKTVIVDYSFEIALLNGRNPVPGTTLDVGKPGLLKRRAGGTNILEVSKWKLLATLMSRTPETQVEDLIIVLGLVKLRLPDSE